MKAIYIRTSTKDQNPQNQLKGIYSLEGCSEGIDIFEDKQSAYKDNVKRPSFDKIISLVESGELTDLYAWSISRLYRRKDKLQDFFRLCKDKGCRVHLKQNDLDFIYKLPENMQSLMLDMVIMIFGWVAEEESREKSARTKASIREYKSTISTYKGNQWGDKLRDLDNNRVSLSIEKVSQIRKEIKELIVSRKTAKEIIEIISNKYSIKISPMMVSRLRKKIHFQ